MVQPFFEQRRAVRVAPSPEVTVLLKSDQKTFYTEIADMSTLGLGLFVREDPGAGPLHIQFQSPDVLAGLNILVQVRRKAEVKGEAGSRFHLGLEYVFSSSDQQNLLLRWLAGYLKETIKETPQNRSPATPYGPAGAVLDIHFPRTAEELQQCYFLLQPLNIYHALVQTKIFALFHQEGVTASMALVLDTMQFKLPADEHCHAYLEELRGSNRKVGEIAIPKFNDDSDILKKHPSMIVRKLHILFSIFIHVLLYAKNFAKLTDLFLLTPFQLQEFCRLWLFRDIPLEKPMPDSKMMRLDLVTLEEQLAAKRPELLEQLKVLERDVRVLKSFQESYFPSKEFVETWFLKKRPLLSNLSEEQKSYFRLLIPDIVL